MNGSLASIVKLSEPPVGYFWGVRAENLLIPENVLVLSRHRKRFPSRNDSLHHRFLLFMNLRTEGQAIIDGVRHQVRPGHAILIFPHQYHHFFWSDDALRWFFITFEMKKPDHIEKLRNRIVAMSKATLSYLTALVESYPETKKDGICGATRVVLLTALLLNELIAQARFPSENIPSENKTTRLVDEINKHIHAGIDKPITIKELAEVFSYSPSRLRALYKRCMKISLGRYIKETRLRKAQGYLGNTDMKVQAIAEACGYDSIYAFSHAFKKCFGISPSGYRKKIPSNSVSGKELKE